jgi:hypothetical protein
MPKKPKRSSRGGRRPRLPKDELETLVEEATIDAYGVEEQVTSFYTVLDEHLALPFGTVVLGVDVTVEKLDLTDDSDDIVIVCRRGRERQRLPILDLPLPDPPPEGWQWIEAYRYWSRGWRDE